MLKDRISSSANETPPAVPPPEELTYNTSLLFDAEGVNVDVGISVGVGVWLGNGVFVAVLVEVIVEVFVAVKVKV